VLLHGLHGPALPRQRTAGPAKDVDSSRCSATPNAINTKKQNDTYAGGWFDMMDSEQ
jgi:hypothetical protein